MKLAELITEDLVVLPLHAADKWEALRVVAHTPARAGRYPAAFAAEVEKALVLREKSMTTGMENGIAIPHSSVPQVDHPAVALGVSRAGIDFQAIDGRPTHLVILLVNPANQTKAHIRTLAEIARLLSSSELRSALVRSESAADVLSTIRAAEAVAT